MQLSQDTELSLYLLISVPDHEIPGYLLYSDSSKACFVDKAQKIFSFFLTGPGRETKLYWMNGSFCEIFFSTFCAHLEETFLSHISL